ncbi:JmjC domain-containing protein [Archangium sp.]|uniref:JmjC domain-containing protein n=1 Tax=Archangium sp. TaxID=1872627 RepID=UPI002D60EAF3|nr:cupin domain-containing protein [Archangium sp.]HYO57023.1 cupin domain-containing protein [Archangium sp.]
MLIDTLLGDFPRSAFFQEHYLKQPLARPSTAAHLRELATWATVERLVETPSCDLLLVRDGVLWSGPRPTSAREARALFEDGYSLALRHADRYDAGLAELGRTLSAELQGTVNLQVYCTPAGHGSFGWHCDPEEVFIFQTAGAKRYLLRRNTLNPTPLHETLTDETNVSRERTPIQECRLEAGDWIYIPGGYWHEVRAPDQESISISVGLMPPTPIDILDFVRTHLLRSPTWQQRLPLLGHASPLSDPEKMEAYRSLFRELGDELKRMMEDPRFVLRFMAAAATAGLRSSVLREGPPREPER